MCFASRISLGVVWLKLIANSYVLLCPSPIPRCIGYLTNKVASFDKLARITVRTLHEITQMYVRIYKHLIKLIVQCTFGIFSYYTRYSLYKLSNYD